MSQGNYADWFDRLGLIESSDNYSAENSSHFLGRYQMGELALQDAGYYNGDVVPGNDWSGSWAGTDGVYSKSDFLSNHTAQDNAVAIYIPTMGLDC